MCSLSFPINPVEKWRIKCQFINPSWTNVDCLHIVLMYIIQAHSMNSLSITIINRAICPIQIAVILLCTYIHIVCYRRKNIIIKCNNNILLSSFISISIHCTCSNYHNCDNAITHLFTSSKTTSPGFCTDSGLFPNFNSDPTFSPLSVKSSI